MCRAQKASASRCGIPTLPPTPISPPEELTDVPVVCGSLREALGELRDDHAFLLKGDVFSMDQIEAYMELKWEEVYAFEHTPHPIEFQMYYSV